MTTEELGRLLRATRVAQGLRQAQLAAAAGVGVRFVSFRFAPQARRTLQESRMPSVLPRTSTRGRPIGCCCAPPREGERPPAPDFPQEPTKLEEGRLAELLDSLPERPLLAGLDGLRLSLAVLSRNFPSCCSTAPSRYQRQDSQPHTSSNRRSRAFAR
jgi:hypothetical protein